MATFLDGEYGLLRDCYSTTKKLNTLPNYYKLYLNKQYQIYLWLLVTCCQGFTICINAIFFSVEMVEKRSEEFRRKDSIKQRNKIDRKYLEDEKKTSRKQEMNLFQRM